MLDHLLHLIHGLAFFTLGVLSFLKIRLIETHPLGRLLVPLGLFGFAHAIHELVDMFIAMGHANGGYRVYAIVMSGASFAFLLAFAGGFAALRSPGGFRLHPARRGLLVACGLAAVVALSFGADPDALETAMNRIFGAPAFALAGYAFVRMGRESRSDGALPRILALSGVSLAAYGVLDVTAGPMISSGHPSSIPAHAVLRIPLALLAAAATGSILRALTLLAAAERDLLRVELRETGEECRASERRLRTWASAIEGRLDYSERTKDTIISLLRIPEEPLPMDRMLERALDRILTIPWLPIEPRGGIFLFDARESCLVMKAHRGLAPALLESCTRVPVGRCLCGRAAATRELVYSGDLDGRHDIRHAGILPHGHYCAPIVSGERLLGVLNLYLRPGHAYDAREVEVVLAIADVLAGLIRHKLDDDEREALQAKIGHDQKLSALGTLAGGIAHEFNNRLTVIVGRAEMLLAGAEEGSRLHADLSEILDAATRSGVLTGQILEFSRTRRDGNLREADLNRVVRGMCGMLKRLLGEDHALDMDLSAGPLAVRCDEGGMEQIVMNLVLNARDATPPGGSVQLRTGRVVGSGDAASATARVFLSVQDRGKGMDAATVERMFEPFYTTKEVGCGTGLGLSIVHGIVERHGGRIEVRSEPGRGTTMNLILPEATAEEPPGHPPATADRIRAGRGERVLAERERDPASHSRSRIISSIGRGSSPAPRWEASPPRP